MSPETVSYRAILATLADLADLDPPANDMWGRDTEIDLRTLTYQDWVKWRSTPTPIEGLTAEVAKEILADICRINGVPLEELALVDRITFGRKNCISTGTEPMWRYGWELRAGSLALKWDFAPRGRTLKGCALRALAECAGRSPSGRSWVGSLRSLLEGNLKTP